MSSAKGPAGQGPGPGPDGKGKEGPGGKGLGGKEGAVATAAGVAIAAGIAWSVYRSVVSRKEEDALIDEYYGSRDSRDREYSVADPCKDADTDIKEKVEEVEAVVESEIEVEEPPTTERGWFFGGDKKKKPKKPKHKPGKVYEIVKGDTLYGISQQYGVSVEALKAANGFSGDIIYHGETLTIP